MSIDSMSGRRIADYRIESMLGRGGQGVVYLAEHTHLGRKVALKLLSPEMAAEPEFRSRFVSESRIAASLDHPNILDVYDGGESDGELYVAVRLVGGSDLAAILSEQGRLSPDRALDVLEPVAAALDFAHAHGLVHRDVKPGNVLIEPPTPERDHEGIFLADFGLTKRVSVDSSEPQPADASASGPAPTAAEPAPSPSPGPQGPVTQAGFFLGTPEFAAPEQVRGEPLTGAADQYALACVLFQCLTGELPFERDSIELLLIAHATEPPPSLRSRRPELPERLDEVVARGMAKEPAARYPSCTAFIRAARQVLRESPKVFISYSRGDKPFVERLHAGLADRGRDTWVDWVGIPPSAVWMAEIRQAIDQAAAFVFVISPDSIESSAAREELAHAEAANKRIVPIVYRDVKPELLPQSLSSRNWIFMRPGEDQDDALRKVLEAIDLDPEWVDTHTRLLTRAREWEASGRKASLALRGSQLKGAEEWLASARGREPPPAQLHTEYILASRRRAGRRQRSGFAVVTAAFLVVALLAGLAFVQRQAANHQRNVAREQTVIAQRQRAAAVRQAQLALSRQLTAQALPLLDTHLDLGLLLALQAYRTAPTTQASNALLAGVQDSAHLVRFLRGANSGQLRTVDFSSDGRTLAVGAARGTVLWDVATGQRVGSPIPGEIAAFSPDGSILAVGGRRVPVTLWDATTREQLGTLGRASASAGSEGFSPDGSTLAVGSSRGGITLWDVAARRQVGGVLREPRGPSGPNFGARIAGGALNVEFSPDGKLLVAGTADDVQLWDVASHRLVAVPQRAAGRTSFAVSGAINRAVFSPNGQVIAMAGSGNAVRLWNIAKQRLVAPVFTGHTATVTSLAFAPDGRTLAAGSADDTVIRWDVGRGVQVGAPLIGHTIVVTGLTFSPDGATLASGGIDGTVILWGLGPQQPVVHSLMARNAALGVAFSPDGATLAEGGLGIRLVDAETGSVTGKLPATGPPPGFTQAVAFSPDGATLAAGTQAPPPAAQTGPPPGGAPTGSPPTGQPPSTGPPTGSPPTGSPPTGSPPTGSPPTGSPPTGSPPSGPAAGPGHGAPPLDSVILWDVATGTTKSAPLPIPSSSSIASVAFSHDGKVVAAGTTDGTAAVFDVASGRTIHEFQAAGGAVAFSPDATTLAIGGSAVGLVDIATGSVTHVPVGAPVLSVTFSPDGRTVAAGEADGSIALVDSASHRRLGAPLSGHTTAVTGVAFSPDGSLLASSSADATVVVWEVRTHTEVGAPLRPSVAPVTSVVFSRDGSTLASSSIDGNVALWNRILFRFDAEAVQSRLCDVVGRNLTQDEWNEFLPGQLYQRTCQKRPTGP
jgi:WD40 repeat protein/serine/threonine protein kinase